MSSLSWGIDLGGTKIEGVVMDGRDTESGVLARLRIPTESGKGYDHILDQIARLVSMLADSTGSSPPQVIGIGTPGSKVLGTGKMKNCNTTCLNGRELQRDLEAKLGLGVKLANDADCFALAEARLGAGRGAGTVFGVIMGTGVGGGIVVDSRLVQGPNGLSGEWGHMTLDWSGPECYCGRRGCVETYLSGPSVERHHREVTGEPKALKQIAESDLPADQATVEWMCENFGRAMAQVVNLLDPDVIVLGGGAGQVPQLRTRGIEHLRANVFGPDFTTRVVAPELGDSAGVFGAALLAI